MNTPNPGTAELRQFGGTFALTREQIAQSKDDRIKYEREKLGSELGVKIAQEKIWSMRPEGELFIGELRVIVFTPSELKSFIAQQRQQAKQEFADLYMQAIDKEIIWCEKNPDKAFHAEYRKGFVNGLIQAKYFITQIDALLGKEAE